MDDVVGVAAGALIPVATFLLQSTISITPLITTLWDALKKLDDLSSSTHSIMNLVSIMATPLGILFSDQWYCQAKEVFFSYHDLRPILDKYLLLCLLRGWPKK